MASIWRNVFTDLAPRALRALGSRSVNKLRPRSHVVTSTYHIHVTYDRCGWLQSTMSCNDSTLLLVDAYSPLSCSQSDPAMHKIETN